MVRQVIFILVFCCFSFLGFGQVDTVVWEIKDTVVAKELLDMGKNLARNRKFEDALLPVKNSMKIYEGIFGKTSLEVADCSNVLGSIYYPLNNIEKAKNAWECALNIRLQLLNNKNQLIGDSYNNLGIYYSTTKSYEKAIEYFEKALAIRKNNSTELHPHLANHYGNIGRVYVSMGKFYEAIPYYEEALTIRKSLQLTNTLTYSENLSNLGILYKMSGNTRKAIQFQYNSLNIIKDIVGLDHPVAVNVFMNLSGSYYEDDNMGEAIKACEKGIEIVNRLPDEYHITLIDFYNNLGSLYQEIGDYSESEKYLLKAIDVHEEITKDTTIELSNIFINLAILYYKTDEIQKAESFQVAALDFLHEEYSEPNPVFTSEYNNLAVIKKKHKDYDLSISLLKKGLYNSGYDVKKQNLFKDILSYSDVLITLNSLGQTYREAYSHSQDLVNLEKSHKYLSSSLSILDSVRINVKNDYSKKNSWIAQQIYNNYLKTNYSLYKNNENLKSKDEMFTISEKSKSYKLLLNVKKNEAFQFAKVPDYIINNEKKIENEISFYEKIYRTKISSGQQKTDSIILLTNKKLFNLYNKRDSLRNYLENNFDDYYNLLYGQSLISVVDIQKDLLRNNETFLEYFVGDSSIFLFVINQDDYQVHEIKKDFPLEEWMTIFREANENSYYEDMTADYNQVAYNLYQKLIAPVAADLKEKLIIVPDGVLGYLPFEALLKNPIDENSNFKKHDYLLKDKQISYCYSATLLREMREKQAKQIPTKDFVGFAPYFDGDTTLLADLFRYADEDDKVPLAPLPESGTEVYGIETIINGDVFYNEDATEDAFVANSSDYRIIHLATHGRANDKSGDYSYLAFTEQKDSIENELLYVRDLYNLQLNADMVVLSACETGIGELQKGEGIISMARGFTYAGAKSIITSLWKVEDEATRDLMISFYKNIKLGMSKDAALRKAKLDYIENVEDSFKAHPIFWSGFIGIGDMRKMEF